MIILLMLIPLSLMLMALAVGSFVWAVRKGQFDDMDTPALDILREDAPPAAAAKRVDGGRHDD
jgi:cbb3-type cytochrome oxidase maturation protein